MDFAYWGNFRGGGLLSMGPTLSSFIKENSKNHKTLPWEHHIGCQICQIAISKNTEQVFFYSSNCNEKITQPLHNKIRQAPIFFFFIS